MKSPERMAPGGLTPEEAKSVEKDIKKRPHARKLKLRSLSPNPEGGEKASVSREEERLERGDRARAFQRAVRESFEKAEKELPDEEPGQWFIEMVRDEIREFEAMRDNVWYIDDEKEGEAVRTKMSALRKEITADLEMSPDFEAAYREYLREKLEYVEFRSVQRKLAAVREALHSSAVSSYKGSKKDVMSLASFEKSMSSKLKYEDDVTREDYINELKYLYGESDDPKSRYQRAIRTYDELNSRGALGASEEDVETLKEEVRELWDSEKGSAEYEKAVKKLEAALSGSKKKLTKAELEEEERVLRAQELELWESYRVRYHYAKENWRALRKANAEGKDVFETPTVIARLNKMHEWEREFPDSLVGGIFVGPPGTGKSTLVHHYCELKGRELVYIDLSKDATRYLLFGSKDIEFKTVTDRYQQLVTKLKAFSREEFDEFLKKNTDMIAETFRLSENEAAVVAVEQLNEALSNAGDDKELSPDVVGALSAVRKKVEDFTRHIYSRSVADEFMHLVKKNGWRDGVVIAPLRRGASILFDEYNKMQDWSALNHLMSTAKPGEQWYFADNNEYITISPGTRFYFTANIGGRYGVFKTPETLADRARGRVMTVEHLPSWEEMRIALAALSDFRGVFIRPKEDLVRLSFLINNIFPALRDYLDKQVDGLPVSLRLVRSLAAKLVQVRDPKTGIPVYRSWPKSFDRALYEALIEVFGLYEKKDAAKHIVKYISDTGIFTSDPDMKPEMLTWMTEEEYQARQKAYAEKVGSFEDALKRIRGETNVVAEANALGAPPAGVMFRP